MHLQQIKSNFASRQETSALQAFLNPGATEHDLINVEDRLRLKLPAPVAAFYSAYNGLMVQSPKFEILPVNELRIDGDSRIHFATADGVVRVCFDSTRLNEASQWDIIECVSGYRITLSMASFWTNMMWKWIDYRKPFWQPDF